MESPRIFKIVVEGADGIGKIPIILKYCGESSGEQNMTVGCEFHVKTEVLDSGERVKLQLWDMENNTEFQSLYPAYFRGASGAVICFDLAEKDTLLEASERLKIVREWMGSTPTMLIGLNPDAEDREVSHEMGREFAKEHGITAYVEASVKNGFNIPEAFRLFSEILAFHEDSETLELSPELKKKIKETSSRSLEDRH